MSGRLLGVDLGEKRIGLALSDPTGFLASTLRVVPSRGRAKDAAALTAIAREVEAAAIVLGLPLSMNGDEGPQAQKTRRFGEALRKMSGLEIHYWDESLTTSEAQRHMRESGVRRDRRRQTIDAAAAALILQGFLDSRTQK